MFFRKTKAESVPEKFARLLSFRESSAKSTASLIQQLKLENNVALALENYSHLIDDHSDISVMLWRRGEDPRQAIIRVHQAYKEMISYRYSLDPDHNIPMDEIAGITEWDLVYSLFWLIGKKEEFDYHFPYLYSERYFAYSRFILHRITDTDIPEPLSAAVESFQLTFHDLVDRNFRDLLMLLGDEQPDDEVDVIVARISSNWLKRRNLNFYQASAPLLAGFDASNDLSVDYQLACILKKNGWQFAENPHFWRWD